MTRSFWVLQYGALCGKISFGIVDYTIVLGLFNGDSGIFF